MATKNEKSRKGTSVRTQRIPSLIEDEFNDDLEAINYSEKGVDANEDLTPVTNARYFELMEQKTFLKDLLKGIKTALICSIFLLIIGGFAYASTFHVSPTREEPELWHGALKITCPSGSTQLTTLVQTITNFCLNMVQPKSIVWQISFHTVFFFGFFIPLMVFLGLMLIYGLWNKCCEIQSVRRVMFVIFAITLFSAFLFLPVTPPEKIDPPTTDTICSFYYPNTEQTLYRQLSYACITPEGFKLTENFNETHSWLNTPILPVANAYLRKKIGLATGGISGFCLVILLLIGAVFRLDYVDVEYSAYISQKAKFHSSYRVPILPVVQEDDSEEDVNDGENREGNGSFLATGGSISSIGDSGIGIGSGSIGGGGSSTIIQETEQKHAVRGGRNRPQRKEKQKQRGGRTHVNGSFNFFMVRAL